MGYSTIYLFENNYDWHFFKYFFKKASLTVCIGDLKGIKKVANKKAIKWCGENTDPVRYDHDKCNELAEIALVFHRGPQGKQTWGKSYPREYTKGGFYSLYFCVDCLLDFIDKDSIFHNHVKKILKKYKLKRKEKRAICLSIVLSDVTDKFGAQQLLKKLEAPA